MGVIRAHLMACQVITRQLDKGEQGIHEDACVRRYPDFGAQVYKPRPLPANASGEMPSWACSATQHCKPDIHVMPTTPQSQLVTHTHSTHNLLSLFSKHDQSRSIHARWQVLCVPGKNYCTVTGCGCKPACRASLCTRHLGTWMV